MPARMPARTVVLTVTLVLAAGGLAGCFGAENSDLGDPRTFVAEGPAKLSMAGWAYDGAGLETVTARIEGTVNDADNSGSVVVSFNVSGQEMRIEFDEFAEADGKAFMDGGVVFDIVEHGDSGVSTPAIPKILALIAAWGEARFVVDGSPVADTNTGGPTYAAHVMVSDDTVRQADGKITKADGTAPYDPATPGDAMVIAGDRQILFHLAPHAADGSGVAFEQNESVTVSSQEDVEEFPIPGTFGALGSVTIRIGSPADPVPAAAGTLDVRILSPSGAEAGSATFQASPATVGQEQTIEWTFAEAGEYVVRAVGSGGFTYDLAMRVDYAAPMSMTLTWDELEIS